MEKQPEKNSGKVPEKKDSITKDEANVMLKSMREVGRMNEVIYNHYMWAIDFIEDHGLKIEFGKFLLMRKRIN
ncbi:MAG: hypothetical protein JW731_14305 [Bacteroidales bacterium]|nr:hypothetical protein [Bacteroidales bacterium]